MRAFACTSTCGAHVRLAGAATQRSPRARVTPLSSAPSEHDDVGVWRLSAGRARGRPPPRRPPQRGGRTRARPAAAARTMVRPCDSSVVMRELAFENTQEGEDPSHHMGVPTVAGRRGGPQSLNATHCHLYNCTGARGVVASRTDDERGASDATCFVGIVALRSVAHLNSVRYLARRGPDETRRYGAAGTVASRAASRFAGFSGACALQCDAMQCNAMQCNVM